AAALDDHVQWLAPDALLSELPRADLLLSPAAAGDLPLALKEAMALGVLVVATPVGGVPELLVDGVSRLLTPHTSAAPLVLAPLPPALRAPRRRPPPPRRAAPPRRPCRSPSPARRQRPLRHVPARPRPHGRRAARAGGAAGPRGVVTGGRSRRATRPSSGQPR